MSANVANKKKKKKGEEEPEEVGEREGAMEIIDHSCLGGGREEGETSIRDGFVRSRKVFKKIFFNLWGGEGESDVVILYSFF